MSEVSSQMIRKSVATLLREYADENGMTYEARMIPDFGGMLGYFVGGRRVTPDEIKQIMDSGRVDNLGTTR